jgi:hypothetical protein
MTQLVCRRNDEDVERYRRRRNLKYSYEQRRCQDEAAATTLPNCQSKLQSGDSADASAKGSQAAEQDSQHRKMDLCLASMMKIRLPIPDDDDHHGRLGAVCDIAVEFDLADDQAIELIKKYAAENPASWSADDHTLRAAVALELHRSKVQVQRGGALIPEGFQIVVEAPDARGGQLITASRDGRSYPDHFNVFDGPRREKFCDKVREFFGFGRRAQYEELVLAAARTCSGQ